MKRITLVLLALSAMLALAGCGTEAAAPVEGSILEKAAAEIDSGATATLEADSENIQETAHESECDELMAIAGKVGVKNAYPWVNTAALDEKTDALIRLAENETGEYSVYGIMSREYGTYGLLLNDVIDGEDNFNIECTEWYYSGIPEEQPILETNMNGEYTITYVYRYENDAPCWKKCILDCGYDTGHMELIPAE